MFSFIWNFFTKKGCILKQPLDTPFFLTLDYINQLVESRIADRKEIISLLGKKVMFHEVKIFGGKTLVLMPVGKEKELKAVDVKGDVWVKI